MSPKVEQDTGEPTHQDGNSAPAEFMEPEPPILANEVSMLVDCFKVWIDNTIALIRLLK